MKMILNIIMAPPYCLRGIRHILLDPKDVLLTLTIFNRKIN